MNEVETVRVEGESVIDVVELDGYDSAYSSGSLRLKTLIRGEEHNNHRNPRLRAVPEE